jgi:hypothetical protein
LLSAPLPQLAQMQRGRNFVRDNYFWINKLLLRVHAKNDPDSSGLRRRKAAL